MIESDYTVIPAHVVNAYNLDAGAGMDQVRLLQGEVVELIPPQDPRNLSKLWDEYVVEVQIRTREAGVHTKFYNCVVADAFGSAADRIRYRLRVRSHEKAVDGAKVLILCINGISTKPIIIGGLRDQDSKTPVSDEGKGQALEFEFNGVGFTVADSGALTLTWAGATDADGAPKSKKPKATFEVDADGNVKISASDSDQSLVFNVDGTWTLTTPGDSKILSSKLLVGAATDAMMLGTRYRSAESQAHTQIIASLTTAVAALTAAGSALTAAAASHLIPVIGPVTASPVLGSAGAAVVSAATAIAQVVTAISTFEAKAVTYLSKNKLD